MSLGTTTDHEQLVQLSRKSGSACPAKSVLLGPLADKFFIAGAVASIFGIGWMGVHLWLASNGQIPLNPFYADLRRLHLLIQIYLFFGIFILGFIAQAGPRLVGSKLSSTSLTLLWIPALVGGVLAWYLAPGWGYGQWIVSAVFVSVLFYMARFQASGDVRLRRTTGRFLFVGLGVFALSPFFAIEHPSGALLCFWGGVAALITGTGQQFIAAFLGGRRCTENEGSLLLILVILTTGCLALGTEFGDVLFRAAGVGALMTVCCYIASTELYRAWRTAHEDALALGFLIGYGWASVGSILLVSRGGAAADIVFHLWAIGWATPLILAVSAQIMSYMSGRNSTRSRSFVVAVLVWQFVPVGRSLTAVLSLPGAFSWLVSVAAGAVLLFWFYQLIAAERVIILRRLMSIQSEKSRVPSALMT